MKTCSVCGEHLGLSSFVKIKQRKNGYSSYCNNCRINKQKKYRLSRRDRVREIERRHRLKKQYGISIEEYDSMLLKQNGGCAICGSTPNGKRLNVDHCHSTGKVRGLLCHLCNRGLGLFKDNAGILESAIKYLKDI